MVGQTRKIQAVSGIILQIPTTRNLFKSLPYSQFRRAMVACSDLADLLDPINYKYGKTWYKSWSDFGSYRYWPAPQTSRMTTPTGPAAGTLTFVSVNSCYTAHLKKWSIVLHRTAEWKNYYMKEKNNTTWKKKNYMKKETLHEKRNAT